MRQDRNKTVVDKLARQEECLCPSQRSQQCSIIAAPGHGDAWEIEREAVATALICSAGDDADRTGKASRVVNLIRNECQ
jgi:hypothetical protein